jgi:TetR/AcrR family transcriptional regulator, fatty acid metabolism regulator protein
MRKREGNKEKDILEAAVKVFAENGYHRAKVTAIADVAGVATGSVYLYYANKESILLKIFEKLWMDYTQTLQDTLSRSDYDPTQKLDLVVDHLFDMFTVNPALAVVFVNEQQYLIGNKKGNIGKYYNNFLDLAEEIIHEGVKKKIFNPEVDVKIYRHFITGGIRSVLFYWAESSSAISLDRVRTNVKYFLRNGLRA